MTIAPITAYLYQFFSLLGQIPARYKSDTDM